MGTFFPRTRHSDRPYLTSNKMKGFIVMVFCLGVLVSQGHSKPHSINRRSIRSRNGEESTEVPSNSHPFITKLVILKLVCTGQIDGHLMAEAAANIEMPEFELPSFELPANFEMPEMPSFEMPELPADFEMPDLD